MLPVDHVCMTSPDKGNVGGVPMHPRRGHRNKDRMVGKLPQLTFPTPPAWNNEKQWQNKLPGSWVISVRVVPLLHWAQFHTGASGASSNTLLCCGVACTTPVLVQPPHPLCQFSTTVNLHFWCCPFQHNDLLRHSGGKTEADTIRGAEKPQKGWCWHLPRRKKNGPFPEGVPVFSCWNHDFLFLWWCAWYRITTCPHPHSAKLHPSLCNQVISEKGIEETILWKFC